MNDTEPSSKRAEANRRNAQKSTGPRTPTGKDRARFNAVKHGMRAKTAVLPGEDTDAFQARMDAWTIDLKPADDVERFLVARAVQLSWQLERADRALAARPAGDRLDELADEVAALGRRLFWDPRGPTFFYPQFEVTLGDPRRVSWSGKIDDPDDPARLVNRLESTALGCAWLLDRWGELRAALEEGRAWEPSERFKAIRLLGRQPLDIDEDERVLTIYASCTAIEQTGLIALRDLTNELHFGEQKRLADWINRRWAAPEDRPDAETGKASLLALVGEEEGRLEELLAMHLERPESSGPAMEFDASEASERLRRYQATCDRSLLRILEALRKRRRDASGPGSETRRPARPTKSTEQAPDPMRRIAGLLNLVAAARDAGATNEANGSAAPVRPCPPDETEVLPTPMPADEIPAATNEANEPAHEPARSSRSRPAAVLAMLVLLACAAVTAAFARDAELTRPGGAPAGPRRTGFGPVSPRDSTHTWTQTSSPRTSQRNRCTEFPLTVVQRPSESRNRHR